MSQPSLNQMQQAFFKAAAEDATKSVVKRIAKVADRINLREPKDHIKLSFRTAQKLKNEGVIPA